MIKWSSKLSRKWLTHVMESLWITGNHCEQKMWYQHMIPSMKNDLLGSDVMGATLQPLFFMIENATDDEYNNILFNEIKNILNIPRSVQASVTLLENVDMLVRRSSRDQVVNTLLPMVISSLDSSMPQIQVSVSRAHCPLQTHTLSPSLPLTQCTQLNGECSCSRNKHTLANLRESRVSQDHSNLSINFLLVLSVPCHQ